MAVEIDHPESQLLAQEARCGVLATNRVESDPHARPIVTGPHTALERCTPAKLEAAPYALTSLKGFCAGHKRRPRRLPDRDPRGQHPVRPVGQPGVLRFVVPVPGQQRGWTGTRSATATTCTSRTCTATTSTRRHLRAHVNKDAVVLLPDFPVPDLRRELEKLGFHRFFETTDSVKHRVSGPKGDWTS